MTNQKFASKCHDIQVSLGSKQVPEFELLPQIGMMVNLSLHIRGLPIIEYDKFRLIASHYFGVPPIIFKEIIIKLAEVEFIRLVSEGSTIKQIIPQVPFFENIYNKIGEFTGGTSSLNEPEQIALEIWLSSPPHLQRKLKCMKWVRKAG